jgi:hypothetical protein
MYLGSRLVGGILLMRRIGYDSRIIWCTHHKLNMVHATHEQQMTPNHIHGITWQVCLHDLLSLSLVGNYWRASTCNIPRLVNKYCNEGGASNNIAIVEHLHNREISNTIAIYCFCNILLLGSWQCHCHEECLSVLSTCQICCHSSTWISSYIIIELVKHRISIAKP